jgi:hypothetical protein
MSTKMMDCTPEQLPLELKMQLMTLLQCGQNDLDAYIRPGCVHLTVNMSLDQNCGQHVSNLSARTAANNLLQGSGAEFWASRTLLVLPGPSSHPMPLFVVHLRVPLCLSSAICM